MEYLRGHASRNGIEFAAPPRPGRLNASSALSYQSFYDEALSARVAERYGDDMENFGYSTLS